MRWLALIAVAALAVLGLLMLLIGEPERKELWTEVGKGLIDVIVVVVLGGIVKRLADAHQEDRRRQDAHQRFREDKYRRIVAATSALRRALLSMRISSDETSGAGLSALLDADRSLRAVKHEIFASTGLADPPFQDPDPIIHELESMYGYTTTAALKKVHQGAGPREGDGAAPDTDVLDLPDLHEDTKPVETWADYQSTEAQVLERIMAESAHSGAVDGRARGAGARPAGRAVSVD
jgi:hypothetical protein